MIRSAVILVITLSVSAFAATYYVCPTGSETFAYDTLAKAARSLPVIRTNAYGAGDVCWVAAGSYDRWSSTVTTNDCTWISIDGPSVTFINGGGSYPLYGCGRFSGFTVTNCGDGAFYIITGLSGGSWMSNCIVKSGKGGFGAICTYDATAVLNVYNTRVENFTNFYGNGGGFQVYAGSTLNLYDCVVTGCVSGVNGGGISVAAAGYSTINRCTFENCSATNDGGGIWAGTYPYVVVSNSVIRYCKSGRYGGAEYNVFGFNLLMYGNESYAADVGMSAAIGGTLHNATIVGNYTPTLNAGSAAMWHTEIFNSVLWFNYPYDADTYSATNCTIQKKTGSLGTTNCKTNYPKFTGVDLSGNPTNTNTGVSFSLSSITDLGIASDSPCVDAGLNLTWDENAVDIAGNARRYNGVVDMGAFEYTPSAPSSQQARRKMVILE